MNKSNHIGLLPRQWPQENQGHVSIWNRNQPDAIQGEGDGKLKKFKASSESGFFYSCLPLPHASNYLCTSHPQIALLLWDLNFWERNVTKVQCWLHTLYSLRPLPWRCSEICKGLLARLCLYHCDSNKLLFEIYLHQVLCCRVKKLAHTV